MPSPECLWAPVPWVLWNILQICCDLLHYKRFRNWMDGWMDTACISLKVFCTIFISDSLLYPLCFYRLVSVATELNPTYIPHLYTYSIKYCSHRDCSQSQGYKFLIDSSSVKLSMYLEGMWLGSVPLGLL